MDALRQALPGRATGEASDRDDLVGRATAVGVVQEPEEAGTVLRGQRRHPVAVGGLEVGGLAAHHAMDLVEEQHPMTSPSLVTWRNADARRT
jgi:hypothetical protein